MGTVVALASAREAGSDTEPPSRVDVPARDGACAVEWTEGPSGSCVRLLDENGTALVEYRPAEGTCRIVADRVELHARDDLDLHAGRRVRIRAEREAEIAVAGSRVRLSPERLELESSEVTAKAERIDWSAALVRTVAEEVETEANRLVQRVGELDTTARRIVERAREMFREAEDLAQTRAGRLRLVAERTLWAFAHRAMWKAEDTVTVRGRRIYLE